MMMLMIVIIVVMLPGASAEAICLFDLGVFYIITMRMITET